MKKIKIFLNYLNPFLNKYTFRNVKYSDYMIIFNWINEKSVRKNSLNQKLISLNVHKSWIKNIGFIPKLFAYPYGETSNEVISILKEFDISHAFGQHSGVVSSFDDRYYLPRFSLNERFGEKDRFEFAVNSYSLDVNNFLLSESEFIVNDNNVELDLTNSYPLILENKISFNELLINLFEVENNLKFKVFDTEVDGKSIQNVVLKFSNFENSLNALQIMSKSENFSLKKAILEDNSDSIHLYISILQ